MELQMWSSFYLRRNRRLFDSYIYIYYKYNLSSFYIETIIEKFESSYEV